MCDLCDSNSAVVKRAKKHQEHLAEQLEGVAYSLRNLASGFTKPHSDDSAYIAIRVKNIIRELVIDWI